MNEANRGGQEERGKNDGTTFGSIGKSGSMYHKNSNEANKHLYNNANYGMYGSSVSGLSGLQNFGGMNNAHNGYPNGFQNLYSSGGYQNMGYQMGSYANYQGNNYLYNKNENYYQNFRSDEDNTNYYHQKDSGRMGGVKGSNNRNSSKEIQIEEEKKEEQNKNIDMSTNPMNNSDNYVELYINKVKEIYYFHVFYHYLKLGYPEKEAAIESKKYIFLTLNRYFLLVKNAILSSPESINQINNCVSSNLSYYQQQTNLQEFLLNQQVNLQSMNLSNLNIGNINIPLTDHEKLGDLSKINSGSLEGTEGINDSHRFNGISGGNNETHTNDSRDMKSGGNSSNVHNFKADKINNMIDSIEEMKKLNKNKKERKTFSDLTPAEQSMEFQNNLVSRNKNMNNENFDEYNIGEEGMDVSNGLYNSHKKNNDYSYNENEETKKKISFTLNKSRNKIFQTYNRIGNDPNRRMTNDEIREVNELVDEHKTKERKMHINMLGSNMGVQDTNSIMSKSFANMMAYDKRGNNNNNTSGGLSNDMHERNEMNERNQMKQSSGLYTSVTRENNTNRNFNYDPTNTHEYAVGKEVEEAEEREQGEEIKRGRGGGGVNSNEYHQYNKKTMKMNDYNVENRNGEIHNSESITNNKYIKNGMSNFNNMDNMINNSKDNSNQYNKDYNNINCGLYNNETELNAFSNGLYNKWNYKANMNRGNRMMNGGANTTEQFMQSSKHKYGNKLPNEEENTHKSYIDGNMEEEEEQQEHEENEHGNENRFYKNVRDAGHGMHRNNRKEMSSSRYKMYKSGNKGGRKGNDDDDRDYTDDNDDNTNKTRTNITRSKELQKEDNNELSETCDSLRTYINNLQEQFKHECKNKEFSKVFNEFLNKLITWNRKRFMNSMFWASNTMPTKEDILALDVFFFQRRRWRKRFSADGDQENNMQHNTHSSEKKKKLSAEEIEKRDKRLEKYYDTGKGKKNEQTYNSYYINYNGGSERGPDDFNSLEKLLDKYNYSSCYKNKNFVGLCKSIQKFFFRLTSLPERKNVRSFSVLKCTYAYILHKYNIDRNYKYINEQFRSMRQDMNIQNIFHDDVINIYETNIRICIVNNDLFQFLQCINKLFELYRRLNINKSKIEFLCYKLIYLTLQNMHQEFLVEYVTLSDEEKNHENIQLCYYLNECIKNKMYLVNINMVSPLDDEVNHEYIYYRIYVNDHILSYLPNLIELNENADLNVNLDSLTEFVKQHSEVKTEENAEFLNECEKRDPIKMPYLTNYLIVLFLPKYRLLALINICMTSIKVSISTLTKLLNFENDEHCLSFLEEVNTILKNNEVISKPSLDNLMKSPLLKNKYINHIR
ncbi:hypothetical protein, conserved [Plasmodium gonderi]|uniref:SAC3/GANP/THP3 conserved domain-containing protein n=1 Tax=Plasmodium gonderi TaxID=77519 RepID=A0A1Y1JPK5_PLAGO|nr:hypothetical protein, conserved [Plasmodium gonderi]GAW81994.1 hypothetical protein, conserved [Plasmodium gonderi]